MRHLRNTLGVCSIAMGILCLMLPVQAEMYVAGQVGANIPQDLSNGELSGFGTTVGISDLSLQNSLMYGAKAGYYFDSLKWHNFNLGVEAGQAMAVLVALPVLLWLHRTRWEARTIKVLSTIVLVIGLVIGAGGIVLIITFGAVLLAWGGHLGQSAYWNRLNGGPSDGAAMVSGSPWHMRTLQLDGSGNKNQDRSISPSAIVGELPPFALAPTPRPTSPPGAPGRTPGTGGGAPGIPGGDPQITIPPTSTDPLSTAAQPADGGLAAILATTALGLLAVLPVLRRRRRP